MQSDRILGYFLEEAVEHLNTIEQGLLNLPETVKQPAMIRELFRAAHSIKGSAAMLGLADIQQVGNQFEANFKLLKEQPQIAVDKHLQSLFLESFRFLQAGIEEVKVSSDPYRKDPATPDPIGDPVFEELKAYLQHLLATGDRAPALPLQQIVSRDPAVEQVFGEYVTRKLDEIISLCLQPDRTEIRSEIQQICQKLGNLGENFEFLEWTNLFAACRLAIANPANPLPQLGEIISIAVKQAQVLVLADRHQAVGITPDLAASIHHEYTQQLPIEDTNTEKLDNSRNHTQTLVGRDNHPIILSPQPAVNYQVQVLSSHPDRFVDPASQYNGSVVGFSELEVDSNTELNEFMNLLSDDMPTEGTWMEEGDFFENEIPVKDFDESMLFHTDLAMSNPEQNLVPVVAVEYEEATFYNPEFEDISQLEMVSFLSTTQLAATQNQPLFSGLDLNSTDRQLQPDLTPILGPNNPNLDFSLDRPMSELFPNVSASENWASSNSSRPSTNSAPQAGSNDFQPDLPNISNDVNPASDILCFEEYHDRDLPATPIEQDEHTQELADWIDNTIGDYEVDGLGDFDLESISNELMSSAPDDPQEPNLDDFFDSIDQSGAATDFALAPVQTSDILNLYSNDNYGSIDPLPEPANHSKLKDLDLDDFPDFSPESNSLDNLDLDNLSSLSIDELPSLASDFDADSNNIASHELIDFGDILGDLPNSNLADIGNLDVLVGLDLPEDLDALMIAQTPVANFDDLDALMMIQTPVANLDDLDTLLTLQTPAASLVAPTTTIHPAVTKPLEKPAERRAKQSRTFEQTMRVSVRHLDNLNNLVGELVVNRNTLEQDQNRMRQFVEKLLSEVQKLNEVGKRMQDLYERSLMENSLIASRQQHKPTAPIAQTAQMDGDQSNLMEYDPLEMDRFTPIHLLSQKMIELTVRVRESTADIEFVVDGSTEVTRTLRQITGQLQEDLTKSRMVPFAQTADRLQRGVRDNGLKYGKQVELTVEGRDTLIDKVILESLTDPLIHMVNNAIAHGIESIAERQAAGKPSEGKITIRALHQGNQTIISIADDGAGINTERVKQKAIEKGIITTQKAATMSKSEIYDLLFLPSFSTKDQADELAGRGVGMDVVRTSITEIRGTITTESHLGTGTTFTIRLPLALSIAKALIAVNNKNNIAFPMDGIEDTQDVSPEQIQTNSDGEPCIFWRDEMMPFKPLSDLLGFNRPLARNNFYASTEDDSDLVSILILRSDGNLMAIQVDKIIGDQEIAIKPLQGPASKPLGIAGATVMGDGRIIPIADVMELIALAKGTLSRHVSTEWTTQMTTPTVERPESMVLIVDDSITVRELLSLTFKRAGYRVEQARDGQEAWDKLRAGLPCDIVFCDIEMPRMDGLEFLSRVQKDSTLSKVPVAMLTSRGSDRHRQIASQLGASGYFIKPYLEEALLDAAKRMIKGEVLEIV